jgi:mannose-binding lectin 2
MAPYTTTLSYANSRHSYAFPRIVGMLGDGTKEYDQANDGEANSIGACSVGSSSPPYRSGLKLIEIDGI